LSAGVVHVDAQLIQNLLFLSQPKLLSLRFLSIYLSVIRLLYCGGSLESILPVRTSCIEEGVIRLINLLLVAGL